MKAANPFSKSPTAGTVTADAWREEPLACGAHPLRPVAQVDEGEMSVLPAGNRCRRLELLRIK